MSNFGLFSFLRKMQDGGTKSGHHGHSGRPGQVGGSQKSSATLTDVDEYLAQVGIKKGDVVKVFGLRKDVLLSHIQNCIDVGDGWWGGVFKSQEAVDEAMRLKAEMEASGVPADDKNYIKVSRALARFGFVKGGADYVKGKIAESQGDQPPEANQEPVMGQELKNEPIKAEPKASAETVKEVTTSVTFKEITQNNKFIGDMQKRLVARITNDSIKNLMNLDSAKFKLPNLDKFRTWRNDNEDELRDKMRALLDDGFLNSYMDLGTGDVNAMRLYVDRERMCATLQEGLNKLNKGITDDRLTDYASKFKLLHWYCQGIDDGLKGWGLGDKQFNDGKLAVKENQAFNLRAKLNRYGVGGFGDFLYKEIMKGDDNVYGKSASILADLGVPYTNKDWSERPTNSKSAFFKSLSTWDLNKKGKDYLKGLANGENVDLKALRYAKSDNNDFINTLQQALGENAFKDLKISTVNMALGLRMVNALKNKSIDFLDLGHSPEQNKNMASLLINGLVYEAMLNKYKTESVASFDGEVKSKVYVNEQVNQDLRETYKRLDYTSNKGIDGLDLSRCLFNDDSGSYMNELADDGTLGLLHDKVRNKIHHYDDSKLNNVMANGFMKLGMSLRDASGVGDKFRRYISSANFDSAMEGLAERELANTSEYLKKMASPIKRKVAEKLGLDASKISDDVFWGGADAVIQTAFMKASNLHGDWAGKKHVNAYYKLSSSTDKKSQLQLELGLEALNSVLGRHNGASIKENKQTSTSVRRLKEALDLGDVENDYVNTKASAEVKKGGDNVKAFQKVFKNITGDLLKSVFNDDKRGAVGLARSEVSNISSAWESNLTFNQKYKKAGDLNNSADNKMVTADMLNQILSMMTRGGGYYNAFKEDNHYGFGSLISTASACAPVNSGFRMRFENMNNNYRNYNFKVGDTIQLDGQHFTTDEAFAHKCAEMFGEERPIGFRMVGASPFLNLEPHVWHSDSSKDILKKLEEHEGLIAGFVKVKAIKPEVWGDRDIDIVEVEYDWDSLAKFIQLNARAFAQCYNMYGGEDDKKVKN